MPERVCSIQFHTDKGVTNIEFCGVFLQKNQTYIEEKIQTALESKSPDIVFNMKGVEIMTGRCLMAFHNQLSEIYHSHKIVIICESGSVFQLMLFHLGFDDWFSIAENKSASDMPTTKGSILHAA